MNVRHLIEYLEEQDPDAEVYIMSQQNWPFEQAIRGVTTREECLRAEGEDEEGEAESDPDELSEAEKLEKWPAWKDRWSAQDYELPKSDVFLVEGSQTRYGMKVAWDLV